MRLPQRPSGNLPQGELPGAEDFLSLPLDLQLDLLVDEELPEDLRASLLARLDAEPARWRELSIRFLQRQVERRSVRDLMNGGRILPVDFEHEMHKEIPRLYRFPGLRWVTPGRLVGVAAGVLIATTSTLLTLHVMRPAVISRPTIADPDMVSANLPGQSVGVEGSLAVDVPVVPTSHADGKSWHFLEASSDHARRNIVIQPDGTGNALVIPVNTMPVHVY